MGMEYDVYEDKHATLEAVTNAALRRILGTRVLTNPAVAIGSTPANVATGAFDYMIGGKAYSKGAVAAGTAFTDLTVQKDGTTRLYLLAINAAGTITIINGKDAVAGQQPDVSLMIPPCPADHCPVGVVKVETDGADFTPATTSLAAATVTDTYVSLGVPLTTL